MTVRSPAAIALLTALSAMGLTGCAGNGGSAKAKAAAPAASAVILTGTNGDMNRYLGNWTSACGHEYRVSQAGTGAFTSGVNAFNLTSVSGDSVQGTLVIDTYPSSNCTGAATRTTANIILKYTGNVAVTDAFGKTIDFIGSADKVVATVVGSSNMDTGSSFNVGFLENFSKFKLAPVDYFSTTDLIYTKK
jgi:hypothetical protein